MTTDGGTRRNAAGDGLFWFAAVLTIVWLVLLLALGWFRSGDFLPLHVSSQPGKLSLNEIGDFLAGIFAPLAFLWFFVSTSLQRIELQETREVLSKQQKELAQSARESSDQTRIMQHQLETSRSREVYEEHRLRM
jgi:hypothetical protein